MKVKKYRQLIEEMVKLMTKKTKRVPEKVKKTGAEIIQMQKEKGLFEGQVIDAKKRYEVLKWTDIPIDHEKQITRIVDRAKTEVEMQDNLARYLKDHGTFVEPKIHDIISKL